MDRSTAGETSSPNLNTFTNTATNDNISVAPREGNVSSDNFLDDGDIDDFSSNPRFDVYEKVEMNHGLLVSTRQAPNTFYHKVVPSKTLQVHINPMIVHQISTPKSAPRTGSMLSEEVVRAVKPKMMKSQEESGGGLKGRLCGEVKNIKSYLTFALALCAIWVQVVTPFA